MNCSKCGIELASPDFRKAAHCNDCWPFCSLCAEQAGGSRDADRRELIRTLYAAGRKLSSCAGCGVSGSELEIHFIEPRSSGGDAVEVNLLVLCPSCHDKVHQGAGIRVGARVIRKRRDEL